MPNTCQSTVCSTGKDSGQQEAIGSDVSGESKLPCGLSTVQVVFLNLVFRITPSRRFFQTFFPIIPSPLLDTKE